MVEKNKKNQILKRQLELQVSIKATKDDDENHILTFIGSDETIDRHGDIVKVDGWDLKNYKKNPVFLWAHNSHQMPIGKAIKVWVDDGKLKFKIKFAVEQYDFAKLAYDMYKGGYLNATSVGFMIQDWKFEGDNFISEKQELFELSAVPVPANPNALRLGFTDDEIAELKKEWKELQKEPKPTDEPVVKEIDEEDEPMNEAEKALFEQMAKDIKSLSNSVKILTDEREAKIKQLEAKELEKAEAAKLEAEKFEAETKAAKEAERLEAEKLEAEKKTVEEAAKLEAEKLEAEKKELEKNKNFTITKDELVEAIKTK